MPVRVSVQTRAPSVHSAGRGLGGFWDSVCSTDLSCRCPVIRPGKGGRGESWGVGLRRKVPLHDPSPESSPPGHPVSGALAKSRVLSKTRGTYLGPTSSLHAGDFAEEAVRDRPVFRPPSDLPTLGLPRTPTLVPSSLRSAPPTPQGPAHRVSGRVSPHRLAVVVVRRGDLKHTEPDDGRGTTES